MRKVLSLPLFGMICLLFTHCSGPNRLADVQIKSVKPGGDPYIGSWHVVVKDTPYGDYPCEVNIEKSGGIYAAQIQASIGTVPFKKMHIEDDLFYGHFYHKGLKVKVKGELTGQKLQGTIGVLLTKYDMMGNKRPQYAGID